MRQFQFGVENAENLRRELKKLSVWIKGKVTAEVLFTIFTSKVDKQPIEKVCHVIKEEFPNAHYIGCSTDGNIVDGDFCSSQIAVSCMIFEYPSTQLKILQYDLNSENYHEVAEKLSSELEKCPWANSVQILTTIRGMSMTGLCDDLGRVRPNVSIFGGGAFSENMNEELACVFSENGEWTDSGIVFTLMGGDDFHVHTTYVAGWKPLGKYLKVTKAKGNILYELDGAPAYNTYYKYLNIGNDESFFYNTLEFPFFYEHNGIDILRAPTASNPDGSLMMSSDMKENVKARIAYGDPWTILESVKKSGYALQEFCPEAIEVFSCAARRTFWGTDDVGNETLPFQSIAPTFGFYTSSEFLRTKGFVNQHNVTLVIVAMREGEPSDEERIAFEMTDTEFSGQVSMINRLATFIKATTEELEEANQRLKDMAITDGLTKVYNRREIQHRINEAVKDYSSKDYNMNNNISLIMMDIDDFKMVNDSYGHKVGDAVLIGLCDMLKKVVGEAAPGSSIGRWGGEEFMVLLPGYTLESAAKVAERIREEFAAIDFEKAGHHTISLGVAALRSDESSDAFCMGVDTVLYQAKDNGKNQVIVRA